MTARRRPASGPKATLGATKYGSAGVYSEESFKNLAIAESWRKSLAITANHGLAKSTWSSYTTAAKMLLKCGEETGVRMSFPLAEQQVLVFIAWLIDRGLSASTMETYMAGIRQTHLANGVCLPILRTPLVKQILEGKKHLDAIERRLQLKPIRLPVVPAVMALLKNEIKISTLHRELKLLIWSVATLAFSGAFRIHELLSRTEGTFDPLYTLLARDLTLRSLHVQKDKIKILQVRLKSEKTDRVGADTIVDVYRSDGPLCPVRAYKKWVNLRKDWGSTMPAFMDNHGKPLTGKKLNFYLKQFLGKHLDYKRGSITSHSFRAGLTSLVAKLGFTELEIQALGRWSSEAYSAYIKLPRTRRLEMARRIGNLGL